MDHTQGWDARTGAEGSARAAQGGEGTHPRSDELARQRQELPWVPINKGYRFETDEGGASLADFSVAARSSRLPLHVRA